MNFFKFYPTVPYVFGNSNGNYTLTVTNLTVHIRLLEQLKKNITVLYDYTVQDGERPDTVSMNVYGTADYTWIILMLNSIFSLYDWPLNTDEFTNYIIERYGSVANAQTTYVYQTVDDYFIDADTWSDLPANERQDPITNYDNELALNEAKRRIQVVPPTFAGPLALELQKLLTT